MRTLLLASSMLGLSLASLPVYASGYGIKVNSTILQGQANAGSAVVADVLSAYTNPAILAQTATGAGRIEAAISGTGIFPNVKYKDFITNTSTGNAARNKFTGSAGVAYKIHFCVTAGIVVSTPYGLAFSYPHTSPVRNYVVESDLKTIAISPSVAFKVNPVLTLGLGVDAQWTDVKFSNYPLQVFPNTSGTAKGDSWTARGTFGVLLDLTKQLRIGMAVKTRGTAKLKGNYSVDNPVVIPNLLNLVSGTARADLPLPTTFTTSISFAVTPRWNVYGDYIRTNWSSVSDVKLRVPAGDSTIVGGWNDSNFFSIGTDYKVTDQFTVRGGVALDYTPTSDTTRVPGIPDSNKTWLALGGSYEVRKNLTVSVSYGHEFFKRARIQQATAGKSALNGQIKESVDLVSMQVSYKF